MQKLQMLDSLLNNSNDGWQFAEAETRVDVFQNVSQSCGLEVIGTVVRLYRGGIPKVYLKSQLDFFKRFGQALNTRRLAVCQFRQLEFAFRQRSGVTTAQSRLLLVLWKSYLQHDNLMRIISNQLHV
ncbi:Hypothetical_protein [Hexamita inflata]|uniref:Hypothetical_protein n=1 Tax=Hexamita inflata TaxID=28002 RepID=A0AA86NK78_9EUKA|nr:Hypothetical protein HINF_LOCUS8332 [Hexamita inflata]